jgi:predicted amidophosphoribosyltransferase
MKSSRPSTQNRSHSQMRANRVAVGNCAFCNKPRGSLAFLCDDCAKKHRERQREKRARAKAFEEEYPDAD